MIKIFYAVAVSAIAAACFVALPTLQQVRATPPVRAVQANPADAGPAVTTCGQNVWPYLDAGCLRSAGGMPVQSHDVRLISADRVVSSTGR